MVKQHVVKLSIRNDTMFVMTYASHWFDSGRVANDFVWPVTVKSNESHTVLLYEKDWALSGCSGYVQYLMGGKPVTIAFSNPSVGHNKVGVGLGTDGYGVSKHIEGNIRQFLFFFYIDSHVIGCGCGVGKGSIHMLLCVGVPWEMGRGVHN